MSRNWLLFLLCLSLLVLLAPLPSQANLTLRVNEATARIFFEEQGARLVLDIESPLGQPVKGRVQVDLVDTDGVLRARATQEETIKPGPARLTLPLRLMLTGKAARSTQELLWYRVLYSIEPAGESQFDSVHGVISLSEIAPEIFALHVVTSRKAAAGSAFRLRVQAAHPLTRKGVAGVGLNAEIKLDDTGEEDTILKQSAQTDKDGFASIDFQIPRNVADTQVDISVEGRRGILVETAESEVEINRDAQVLVTSDKPIYQPGQTLHVRVLMFDMARRALANSKARLRIKDPEDTVVFRSELTSTRFGVAIADWDISENTRLGDYRIEVELDDDKFDESYGAASVKISRYDLPNFAVNVKPDRPFYLPGQNAVVEVRADYLFGQPVRRGNVRVVRETERRWNYREQKWDIEEGDKYEGKVDAEGKFVARIKLKDQHEELKDEDYSRFRDLNYAVYFTDPTTNRTEQRRFDLRLTKDPIHIYFLVGRDLAQAEGFPLAFYLSASNADGTPASCEIAISRVWSNDDLQHERPLRTVKTNQYGLAKVSSLDLGVGTDPGEPALRFRARDSKGAAGSHTEKVYISGRTVVRVETDKALYRDGDPIRVSLAASEPGAVVALDVIAGDDRTLQSRLVTLQNGKAEVVFPYQPEFRGTVSLGASLPDHDEDVTASRTVLYPQDRDLKFNLVLNRETYRPGEEASASFLTRTMDGRAAESALGVVIFDRAVEERARTEREFGGPYGFYYAYCYLNGGGDEVAGVSRQDLNRLDLSQPLPDGMDLVAELLLTFYYFEPRIFQSNEFDRNGAEVFGGFIGGQIEPLKDRLDSEYNANGSYPADLTSLRHLSSSFGIDFDALRDPWTMPYQTSFFAQGVSHVVQMISAGADKRFETADDFAVMRIERPYFRFTGEAIKRAVSRYHTRTGRFIRDAATLKSELCVEGIDFDALRDPWGQVYQLEFGVNRTNFLVYVRSSGPDREFSDKSHDDVLLLTSSIDYSRSLQAKVDSALNTFYQSASQIPQNEPDFTLAVSRSNLRPDDLVDPWGKPYYVTFKQDARYSNRATIYSYAKYGEKPKDRTEIIPVTQQINFVYLRSIGEDGKVGTVDDFTVATFSKVIAEQSGRDITPQAAKPGVRFSGSTGVIIGTVVDPNDAVITGARVTAKNLRNETEYTTTSDDSGIFIVKNLPVGSYQVSIESNGFKRATIVDVMVRSSQITRLNVTLEIGGAAETVSVTASAEQLNTSQSQATVSRSVNEFRLDGVSVSMAKQGSAGTQLSTPRLREYFPETLVWQPSLETDQEGRAELKFKLADNITTWKMSVIASTVDGQIGTVERDIKSFQPFFVEHDPPRVLTEGDEISLPVVVRNYLDRSQTVNLEIKPEPWFALLGPATKSLKVEAGDAMRETFDFRAGSSVKDGKQRITALASEANDAIEKPVTVHPDGEEKSLTASDIFSDKVNLTIDLPPTALPDSARAELKIYPNLLAHVAESVEAIMQRPYGCGEQTISSTYPSLLLLRNFRNTGQETPLRIRAERYLRAGYARLLNYRHETGGFTYWGRDEPDLALTAYALRFLSDARELITVDDKLINDARAWLIRRQRIDGSWCLYQSGNAPENKRHTSMLTAYVTRVLAMTSPVVKNEANQSQNKPVSSEVRSALEYLAARSEEIDEPYLIASFALAALEFDDPARAAKAIARLRALAREENGMRYWSLETNTPFYGWGLAGRVETTALVVQALGKDCAARGSDCVAAGNQQLVDGGLLFLLRQKDRYGVWYSTQATINVLDALLVSLARDAGRAGDGAQTAELIANGRNVKSIELPSPSRLVTPITVDVTQFLLNGKNHFEIRRTAGSSPASVQAVATYYLPWRDSVATKEANWRANGASGLRLTTKFNRTVGKVGDQIICYVEAERLGFRGYGMMLAEIGLPPGADVDRESLEKAMKGSDWSINQYDILPDRVVFYLWPKAGGSKFNFSFRPRFGLNAQSAASTVYDYYNPDARAIVAPARFVVK